MNHQPIKRKQSRAVDLIDEAERLFGLSAGRILWGLATLLAIATAMQCHAGAAHQMTNPGWTVPLLYGAVLWFWWAVVASFFWRAGNRWSGLWHISLKHAALQAAVGIVVALTHVGLLHQTIRWMVFIWPYLKKLGFERLAFFEPGRIALDVLLYMVVWGAYAAARTQMARQLEAVQTAELKEQLSAAHLCALQMQMEPHFLLNTLNAITALVEDGSQKEAAETLAHLNEILKATLVRETPEKVTLAQELAVVEHYLAIEQVRFADRLRVEMSIDPGALDSMIPCFLLQPIVENAIQHGISQLQDAGVIRASVERNGDMLHLSVRDNGAGLASKSNRGHGIGLRNTEGRLAHFYPDKYKFFSGAGESGGFEVSIIIPYERALA
jgi:sensor histidine kinase YesM